MILLIMFAYFFPSTKKEPFYVIYIESLSNRDSMTRATPNMQILTTKPAAEGMLNLCVILALVGTIISVRQSVSELLAVTSQYNRACKRQCLVQADPKGNNR